VTLSGDKYVGNWSKGQRQGLVCRKERVEGGPRRSRQNRGRMKESKGFSDAEGKRERMEK
jgi:hypothetical protein